MVLALCALLQGSVGDWIDQLGSEYYDERRAAYDHLNAAGPEADEPLRDAIYRDHPAIRRAAVKLLMIRHYRGAVEDVGAIFLRTEEGDLRLLAFEYLLQVGAPAAPYLARKIPTAPAWLQEQIIRRLREVRVLDAVPEVAALLEEEIPESLRNEVLAFLGAAGDAGRARLLAALPRAPPGTRRSLVSTLAQNPAPDVRATFAGALRTEDETEIAGIMFDALQRAWSDEVATGLVPVVREAPESSRLRALAIFREKAHPAAREAAAELLVPGTTTDVRTAAAAYLAVLPEPAPEFVAALALGDDALFLLCLDHLEPLNPPDLVAAVVRAFPNLHGEDARVRALRLLAARADPAAEETFTFAATIDQARVQAAAVDGLARLPTLSAVRRLLGLHDAPDEDVREAAQEACRRQEAARWEALLGELAAGSPERALAERLFFRARVEAALLPFASAEGVGTYPGMFADISFLDREPTREVLREMAGDAEYRFRTEDAAVADSLRELAILAIGDVGSEADQEFLASLREGADAAPDPADPTEFRPYAASVLASARLGDTAPLDDFVQRLLDDGRRRVASSEPGDLYDGADRSLHAAILLGRSGDAARAVETYREVESALAAADAAWAESYSNARFLLYNLACLLARADQPDEAMAYLRRAVEAGLTNFEWIARDGDLATLREREDFRELIAGER